MLTRGLQAALLGAKTAARRFVPAPAWRSLQVGRAWLRRRASLRPVNLGQLRRVTPVSRQWGADRGQPIDRFYIEAFLREQALDIRGRVLEVRDDTYIRQFGADRVTQRDVLHVVPGNPQATIVADLTSADHIPSDTFDCIIMTQTLHLIYDVGAALRTLYRILKPGGVLLATLPGISHVSRRDMERWGDCWRFTTMSARRLLAESFHEDVSIRSYGNVLAAVAFLHGLATEEFRRQELEHADADYQVIIAARAVKRPSGA